MHASRLELSLREVAAEPEYLWVGLSARAVGTIVHAELQRLAQLPQLPAVPDAAAQSYDGWLAELGVLPADRAAAGERVHEALARTLQDPRGRWLLGNAHREAHSEWRLTGQYAGRIVNVIIDRMLIDAQGERWLVDYKTSSHEGSDLEGFLAQEAARYGPQLQRYAALVAGASPGPVHLALYFPLLGKFRELLIEAPAAERVLERPGQRILAAALRVGRTKKFDGLGEFGARLRARRGRSGQHVLAAIANQERAGHRQRAAHVAQFGADRAVLARRVERSAARSCRRASAAGSAPANGPSRYRGSPRGDRL